MENSRDINCLYLQINSIGDLLGPVVLPLVICLLWPQPLFSWSDGSSSSFPLKRPEMATALPKHQNPSHFSNFKIMIPWWPVAVRKGEAMLEPYSCVIHALGPWAFFFLCHFFFHDLGRSKVVWGLGIFVRAEHTLLSAWNNFLFLLCPNSYSNLQNMAHGSPSYTEKTSLPSRITRRALPPISVPSHFYRSL